MPSRKQTLAAVHAEIAELERLQPLVPPISLFEDDHFAAIGAQIDVLRHDWGVETIFTMHRDDYVLDAALAALRWAEGESEAAPHLDWCTLL